VLEATGFSHWSGGASAVSGPQGLLIALNWFNGLDRLVPEKTKLVDTTPS
jgi:hypothetical protein